MRKRLIALLKLVFVVGLMAYVFANIQWQDALVERAAAGAGEAVETPGRIVGQWDSEVVTFVPEGGAPQQITTGVRADGAEVRVSPGFLTYVRNLDPLLFIAGALCYFISVATAAARWWWLLRINALPVSLAQAQRYTWIGIFFNNVVPGQTGGDLVKALYVMKHAPNARVAAIVSVLVDRVMGLASLALLGAIVVLFALDRFAELAIAIWAVLLAVVFLGTLAFSRRLRRLVHLDDLLNMLPARISGLLKRVDHAVFFYRQHKVGILGWMLFGVANHVVSVLSVLLIGQSIGVALPPLEYFVLIPIINIVSAVPIAPNGWGVGELLYGELFARYGAAYLPDAGDPREAMRTQGVALSLLYRVHLTLWSLVGGIVTLFERDRVTRADVAAEVERERIEDEGGASAASG